MIQKLIIQKIIQIVIKQITKQFKFNKIQKYVDEPNELDKQMEVVIKKLNKYGKRQEDLEKEVAILNKDSHPPIFTKEIFKELKSEIKSLKGQVTALGDIVSGKNF